MFKRLGLVLLLTATFCLSLVMLGGAPGIAAADVPLPWIKATYPCVNGEPPSILGAGSAAVWMRCGSRVLRSTDLATTWSPVDLPVGNQGTAAVSSDGALVLELSANRSPFWRRLVRFDPATGASTNTDLPTSAFAGGLGWDQAGRTWIAWCDYSGQGTVLSLHMARPMGSGVLADEASLTFTNPNTGQCDPRLRLDGQGSLFLDFNQSETYVPQGAALASVPARILYNAGGLVLATDGAHFDGGPAFGGRPTEWANGYFLFNYGRLVLAERAPGMLASPLPHIDQTRMQVTSVGLFAIRDGLLARFQGSPDWPKGDQVPSDAQAMTDEANRFRAAAGLLPLYSDALIAQAAANHSRYWTLNDPTGLGLEVHHETPGKAGFTGVKPIDRCAAVGGICYGEVMYFGADPVGAVQGWVATAFHRSLLMSPAPYPVGGAKFGEGPAVMDAGAADYLGRPYPYPVNTYDGPLGFGGEIPDPAAQLRCTDKISAPYGTAITVSGSTSFDEDSGIGSFPMVAQWDVQGPSGPVKGCSRGWVFVPDDALEPGSEYKVTVQWANPAQPAMTWSFHTAGVAPKEPTQRKQSRVQARAINKKSELWIKVTPNLGRHVQWRVKVQGLGKHKRWNTVRSIRTKGLEHTRTINLPKGTYRVQSKNSHGYASDISKRVRLRR